MFHFVVQKVTLMRQLNINIIEGYKESPSCISEAKKLPYMKKCLSRFVSIKLLKENDIYNVSPCYVFVRLLMTNDVNSE